jgi:serine protease Do
MRARVRFWLLLAVALVASGATVASHTAREAQPSPMDTGLFRTIARQQNPAVVAVMTTTRPEAPASEDADLLERFLGRMVPREPRLRREFGSGFLISRDGDILTNDHVVAGADLIEVRLLGRETTTYRATIVGRDPTTDSAVIRLKNAPHDLPVVTLGDSDSLETGDWVMAIGNPYRLGHSVTVGVVSYEARSFEIAEDRWLTLIQTDAAINPGSSGGPLLNVRGEVVGIGVAMLADNIGDGIGIGFAIPINSVKDILSRLRVGDVVRGHLGVRLRHTAITELDAEALGLPSASGALVTSVDRHSNARAGGLRASDLVIEFAGVSIANADDLMARVASTPPGARVQVIVVRDGRTQALGVEVDRLPLESRRAARVMDPKDFGLTLGDITRPMGFASPPGVMVLDVREGSAAALAGIEMGDVVRKVNRRAVHTASDALRELQRLPVGNGTAFVLVSREGDELLVELQRD